jgi:hypothetical protein
VLFKILTVDLHRLRDGVGNNMKKYEVIDSVRLQQEESHPPAFFCAVLLARKESNDT